MIAALYIKRFAPEDIKEVVDLEKRAFPVGPYTREELDLAFSSSGSFNFLLYDNDTHNLLGYVVATEIDRHTANIESIAVDPDIEGKGAGSVLLKYIEDEMMARGYKVSTLEVREKNDRAIEFYKKKGYQMLEVVNDFYQLSFKGSKHALRFIKKLS